MKFKGYQRLILPISYNSKHLTTLSRKLQSAKPNAYVSGGSGGGNGGSKRNSFLVLGTTAATIVMLGALHALRLYNDNKIEEAREKGALDVKDAMVKVSKDSFAYKMFDNLSQSGNCFEGKVFDNMPQSIWWNRWT